MVEGPTFNGFWLSRSSRKKELQCGSWELNLKSSQEALNITKKVIEKVNRDCKKKFDKLKARAATNPNDTYASDTIKNLTQQFSTGQLKLYAFEYYSSRKINDVMQTHLKIAHHGSDSSDKGIYIKTTYPKDRTESVLLGVVKEKSSPNKIKFDSSCNLSPAEQQYIIKLIKDKTGHALTVQK